MDTLKLSSIEELKKKHKVEFIHNFNKNIKIKPTIKKLEKQKYSLKWKP